MSASPLRSGPILSAVISVVALMVLGGVARAKETDVMLGSAKAPVTVIEYASVTCPHCAKWEADVFPEFKRKYIDTGKVRYVMRELPTPPLDLSEAGFMIARCAPESKFYDVVQTLMANQNELYQNQDARSWMLKAGAVAGLSEDQVRTCVEDTKAQAALSDRIETNAKLFNVQGTPTFIVNNKMVGDGEVTLAELDKAIGDAQAKAPKLRGSQGVAHHPATKRKSS
jgi:protein-disulfide isomerase